MEANEIRVSYLITTHNETDTLQRLLNQLEPTLSVWDEIVIVDDYSNNEACLRILAEAESKGHKVFKNSLNGNFAAQKNFGISKCSGDYVFQIDSDETLDDNLLKKYKEILHINPDVELFFVPRVNKVKGITMPHAVNWRWNISKMDSEIEEKILVNNSPEYALLKHNNLILSESNNLVKFYSPIINWPDFQTRLYKRSDKIVWEGKVHERIVGHKTYALFPTSKQYSILHYKEIEKQEQQNELYSRIVR